MGELLGKKSARIDFEVTRGETEKHVNKHILEYLSSTYDRNKSLKFLDLPCGQMSFIHHLRKLFPEGSLTGADIQEPAPHSSSHYIQMDLTQPLVLRQEDKFDVITSISGVMMFGNTLNFISNCAERLVDGGTFIITNDNSSTILDKLYYLLLGRVRIFKPIYSDNEGLTQNIPIQEICRLLRLNGLTIEQIKYTSLYKKDLIFLPIAILIYPVQQFFLRRFKTSASQFLLSQMYPFKHYFCRHYIIIAKKKI
jgi:2-polyprenyl-3-methyl-5-hydroxy-6-metoxy-1,4-benzoquinol methylase